MSEEATSALRRIKDIVGGIRFREDNIFYAGFFGGSEVMYVQHRYVRIDAVTGKPGWGYGRKWHVSPHATESEVVLTCLKAAITNAEHEVREDFVYKGAHLFHPHVSVSALADASYTSDARDAPHSEAERAEVLG